MLAMKIRNAIAPLIIVALFPCISSAQNTGFLKDAAVSHFDDQDVWMMMQNADAALNEKTTPVTRAWKNSASGNSGTAEVLTAFTGTDGASCKRARLSNVARNGIKGASTYTFCKREQKWLIMPKETK